MHGTKVTESRRLKPPLRGVPGQNAVALDNPRHFRACPATSPGAESHAVYYRAADGRRVVIPMQGTKDLKPGTLRAIIADLGLSVHDFLAKL
jgi:hypothetical protein